MAILSSSAKDKGLLLIRVGIGIMFLFHGFPKISGGPEVWVKLGGAMQYLGISLYPAFWGFMAAVAEFGGAILLIFGFQTKIAAALMCFTMIVASIMHLGMGDGIKGASHAIELGIVFAGLFLTGPGSISLDAKRVD